jgi:hypothetical protein
MDQVIDIALLPAPAEEEPETGTPIDQEPLPLHRKEPLPLHQEQNNLRRSGVPIDNQYETDQKQQPSTFIIPSSEPPKPGYYP